MLKLDREPRTIEGVDIAHLGGTETVASLVKFIDGLPFKPGYRRFKIRDVQGVDELAVFDSEVFGRDVREAGICEDGRPITPIGLSFVMSIDGGQATS